MEIMPIINKSRNGNINIYNVELKYKGANKVKTGINLKEYGAGDIIINGTSFNSSIYNTKNKKPNSTINFIRNFNYREGKRNFLVTTKEYTDSTLYDLYSVDIPPRKVSAGLDNLIGSTLLDMRSEIPDKEKGRYLSLKEIGLDDNLTEEKISILKEIVNIEKDPEKRYQIMQLRGVSDLYNTIEYMKNFEFTIVSKATISEGELKSVINAFEKINSKDYKSLNRYYSIAQDNKDVYAKLTKINKIIYNEPIKLIKSNKSQKVLTKTKDAIKNAA